MDYRNEDKSPSQISNKEEINKIVPKTILSIKVDIKEIEKPIPLDKVYFTEINFYYSEKKADSSHGIKEHYSLLELKERLNTLSKIKRKKDDPAILKGIYNGGTRAFFCDMPVPFLFFDIDVKKTENKELYDAFTNAKVFEVLNKISVLTWRSKSGLGIAGLLYVPELAKVHYNKNILHKNIGDAVTRAISKYIKNKTGTIILFDSAQSKFRQVRFLTKQNELSIINTNPKLFDINVIEEDIVSSAGVPQFKYHNYQSVTGSIEYQFNNNTNIVDALLDSGFHDLGNDRFKHPFTTSSSSGSVDIDNNVFFNYSSSFSDIKCFTPFKLILFTRYNGDIISFVDNLKNKGYIYIKPTKKDFDIAKNKIKKTSIVTPEVIFDACYQLKYADIQDKHEFINTTCSDESSIQYYYQYLGVKNLYINYDQIFKITKHVSEKLSFILEYTDLYKKVCLKAETGTGKTTAFLRDFKIYRPSKRCLILVPLTVISSQSEEEYKDLVSLTGSSSPFDHRKARTSQIVMATYEQGAKHLINDNKFDYIIIDEVHNLIIANSYKRDVISNLTKAIESNNSKVIGLTGTPGNIIKSLGYKIINVLVENQSKVDVVYRVDNRRGFKIIKQHLKEVRGKSIFRLNNIPDLNVIKEDLIKNMNYKANEILILNSDLKIKRSEDYKYLVQSRKFKDNIKIVLTTSFIDEGLSIEQDGFTDVVFIENSYNPCPESVKQFFARFRNEDLERKNYYYYKERKDQTSYYLDLNHEYNITFNNLNSSDLIFSEDDYNSYNDIANDSCFYYENSVVNTYYLAYQVSSNYFKCFNRWEFNTYLESNYNLKFEIDNTYKYDAIDTSFKELSMKKKKIKIFDLWFNNLISIMHVIHNITSNRKLKSLIDYNGEPIHDIIADFVQENKKTFEKLLLLHFRFIDLREDPKNRIIDFNKNRIRSFQIINRELKLLETISVINNPKTSKDKINRKKIVSFINDILSKKIFSKKDLFTSLKKQKVQNNYSYKEYVLLDIIKNYAVLTYNKKTKKFKIKTSIFLE